MSLAEHIAEKTRKKGGPKSRARELSVAVLRKARDLLDLISDLDKSDAVATLRSGLTANHRYFDSKSRRWNVEPNWRVRHESAMAILAYAYGKPIERQIVATGTFQELSEIINRISASPLAMKKLGHLVPSAGDATNPEQHPEKLD